MYKLRKYKTKTHRHRKQYGVYQREGELWGKGDQIYGDERRFDFGWWAHNAIYRLCIIEMYTWNP